MSTILVLFVCLNCNLWGQQGIPTFGGTKDPGKSINRFDDPNSLNIHVIVKTDLQGQVLQSRVYIEINNTGTNYRDQKYSDENGEARFFGMPPGNYTMRVTGNIEENGREFSFTLSNTDMEHLELIRVHFKSANPGSPDRPHNTVSTNSLNASPKAIEEVNKGKSAYEKKQLDDAKKHFLAALVLYPQFAFALNSLGVIAEAQNDDASAKKYYEQAMEADPAYLEAFMNMGKYASTHQDSVTAEKVLVQYIKLMPLSGDGLMLLTNAQVLNGHYDEAIGNAKKVLSQDEKQYAFAHVLVAISYEGKNMYSNAIEEYQAYLMVKPNSDKAPAIKQAIQNLEIHNKKP